MAGRQAAANEQAVAWAEEAGLVASADAVLAALDGHRVFAEELVFDLLVRLGLRRAVPSAAGV